MAKDDIQEKTTLTIGDGVRFGLGFFMVNAALVAAIILVGWLILLVTRYFGLAF